MIEFFLTNKIDVFATLIGLIYLYLEYKANILMWFVSIVMAILFIWIFYVEAIYGNMTIYIYFLCASVYGWYEWTKSKKNNFREITEKVQIRRLLKGQWRNIIIYCLLVAIIIYPLLNLAGEKQLVLILDTVSTALQIVALLMATKRFAEQWILLVPANFFSALIMLIQGNYATSIMFLVYSIVSVAGYINWKKLAKISEINNRQY